LRRGLPYCGDRIRCIKATSGCLTISMTPLKSLIRLMLRLMHKKPIGNILPRAPTAFRCPKLVFVGKLDLNRLQLLNMYQAILAYFC
jgi:hypothetical protein